MFRRGEERSEGNVKECKRCARGDGRETGEVSNKWLEIEGGNDEWGWEKKKERES